MKSRNSSKHLIFLLCLLLLPLLMASIPSVAKADSTSVVTYTPDIADTVIAGARDSWKRAKRAARQTARWIARRANPAGALTSVVKHLHRNIVRTQRGLKRVIRQLKRAVRRVIALARAGVQPPLTLITKIGNLSVRVFELQLRVIELEGEVAALKAGQQPSN